MPAALQVNLGQSFNDMSGNYVVGEDGLSLSTEVFLPDFGTIGSLYDGFYQSIISGASNAAIPSKQTVRFQCEQGNCTWPVFTTAAICNRCSEVPRDKIKRTTGVTERFEEGSDEYQGSSYSKGKPTPYTGYNVSYGHIRQFNGEFFSQTAVLLTAFINTNYTKSVMFQNDNTTFITFLVMRASHSFLNDSVPWEDSWPIVTECGLSFCAKAYQSNATNGLLQEAEVGSWFVREPKSWSASDVSMSNEWDDHPGKLGRWEHFRPDFDLTGERQKRTDLQVVIPSNEVVPGSVSTSTYRVAREFNFTQTTVHGLQAAFTDLFFNQGAMNTSEGDLINRNFVLYPIPEPAVSKPIANVLWNATNLTSLFDGVSERLSTQIRDSARDWQFQSTVDGAAMRDVLHIKVEWGYFVPLVVTVAFGCAYVIGVLVQTFRLGLPAWKESAYPTLAFAPDDASAQVLLRAGTVVGEEGGNSHSRAVRRAREKVLIGLQETLDGDGYRLRVAT